MKVACDRCLKIVESDFREFDEWLTLTATYGTKFLFCKECAKVFWDTMFYKKDGKQDEL